MDIAKHMQVRQPVETSSCFTCHKAIQNEGSTLSFTRCYHWSAHDSAYPGHCIISVESRCNDEKVLPVIRFLDHAETRLCAETERAFLLRLGQDCRLPARAYACICGYVISVMGMLGSSYETLIRKNRVSGTNLKLESGLAECLREQVMKRSES